MNLVRCVIIRGGTSRGIYIHENELPPPGELRDRIILDLFGSPDIRQIDGLGGADILTSKVCIIGPSLREDVDVDYTFGQVMINQPMVDWSINCGNLSSGVGPFAIDEGIVKPREPYTTVRIYNTNTKKILVAEVPVRDGKAVVEGDFAIDGTPGTGARIALDFAATAGTVKGLLVPTGKPKEVVEIEGVGEIEVSIVDAANPTIFAKAADIGITGPVGSVDDFKKLLANEKIWHKAELVRGYGAEVLGFVDDRKDALAKTPAGPFAAFVTEPMDYVNHVTGTTIKAESCDLRSVIWAAAAVHKAYAVTGSICTAAAALVPGSVVNEVLTEEAKRTGVVRIGHPAGTLAVEARVDAADGNFVLSKAALYRTARRIMEGYAYLKPWSLKEDLPQMRRR